MSDNTTEKWAMILEALPALVAQGLNHNEMAEILGCKPSAITTARKELGISARHRTTNKEFKIRVLHVAALKAEGMQYKEIAEELGITQPQARSAGNKVNSLSDEEMAVLVEEMREDMESQDPLESEPEELEADAEDAGDTEEEVEDAEEEEIDEEEVEDSEEEEVDEEEVEEEDEQSEGAGWAHNYLPPIYEVVGDLMRYKTDAALVLDEAIEYCALRIQAFVAEDSDEGGLKALTEVGKVSASCDKGAESAKEWLCACIDDIQIHFEGSVSALAEIIVYCQRKKRGV